MKTPETETVLSRLLSDVDTTLTRKDAELLLEKIIHLEREKSLSDDYLKSHQKDTREGMEVGELFYGMVHVEAGVVLRLLKALLSD